MVHLNLSTKQKQIHRHREETCGCQGRGRLGGGKNWKFGVSRCKLVHLECIGNEVLLYSTGHYSQSPEINHNVK